MVSAAAWAGVQSLLDNYMEVNSNDSVVIAYTPDSFEAAAWVSAALVLRDTEVRRVPMYPLHDPDFFRNFVSALPAPDALRGRLVVLTFELETMSHDDAIRKALCRYDEASCIVLRSISSCEELFAYALHPSPDELSRLNTAILERCMPAKKLRLKASGGTDLRIGIDSERHRWISNRGKWRPGSFVILPAGEVATYPSSINGVLVADFAFNVNALTDRSARLVERPVTVWIEDGRAQEHTCEDAEVKHFLDQCFGTYCAHNVGELGLGTNISVKSAISLNSHINERRPGVHIGFGQHNQGTGVTYRCNIHLDLIANGGLVWVDDDPNPIDLERLVPSSGQHPTDSRDEDVFSPRI